MQTTAIEGSMLARTGDEYIRLLKSDADWIVRTPDDLRALRSAGDNPLAKVDEDDFCAFVDSLVFKNGGAVTGYYKPLTAALTITEIFDVFEHFGMARAYTLETLEAKCSGGSCSFDFWSFCASNCAAVVENA